MFQLIYYVLFGSTDVWVHHNLHGEFATNSRINDRLSQVTDTRSFLQFYSHEVGLDSFLQSIISHFFVELFDRYYPMERKHEICTMQWWEKQDRGFYQCLNHDSNLLYN